MEPQTFKAIMKEKNKAGAFTLSDLRLYYKTIIIKTACIGTKKDIQINGTELEPRNKPIHL